MNYKKFWASRALIVVVAFILVPGISAQAKFKTLHKFSGGRDGGAPYFAGVIFDQAGNLYGTTERGGAYGYGVVFQLTPNPDGGWKEKVLHHFTGGPDGNGPEAGVIFDQAGNLYGTTYSGGDGGCCGVAFELVPNSDGSWTEKVLKRFTNGSDGGFPYAGLIFDAAGNLYGTTSVGGIYDNQCNPSGCGVVFDLPRKPTVLLQKGHPFFHRRQRWSMALCGPDLRRRRKSIWHNYGCRSSV